MDENKILLVKKAATGDKNALIKLIKEEENNIYTTLYYLKKDEYDINDIAQNVLMKLTKNIENLKNPHYFRTWLNQIIVNTYYDYLRKKKRKDSIKFLSLNEKNIENTELDIPDYKTNPQNSVLYSELDYVIKNSIQNLPPHYKIPIALREIQGLSYDEISNITKTSIGTVKSRIARARTLIKDKIKKYARG